jgi:hypothetical protein
MELLDFLKLLLRRSWLVIVLAGLGGLLAWSQVRDQPVVFEQTVSFAVRPAQGLPLDEVDEALDNLNADGAVIGTVSGTLSGRRFLERAARSVGADAEEIDVQTAVRQESSVIDVRFAGSDRAVLPALTDPFTAVATSWVTDTYRIYALEPLGSVPPTAVEQGSGTLVVLGVGLGLLLGLMAVLTETAVRARRSPLGRALEGRSVRYRIEADDGADPARLEDMLRAHLGDDETIVWTGPRRLAILGDSRRARGTTSLEE